MNGTGKSYSATNFEKISGAKQILCFEGSNIRKVCVICKPKHITEEESESKLKELLSGLNTLHNPLPLPLHNEKQKEAIAV